MSLKKLIARMNILQKTNRMEVAVATSMVAITADRIFNEGRAADNTQIGDYSEAYMKQRKKMNYPNSTKVILQATRQMVNDFSVISTGDSLGLGFKNSVNFDKSLAVEMTYGVDIFKHTDEESEQLNQLLDQEVKKILNG